MRRGLSYILAVACLAAAQAKAEDPNQKVWELTEYLKGTPTQLRSSLYKEIIRIMRVSRETHRQLADAQAELGADSKSVIARAHERPEFKALFAQLEQAKQELDRARTGASTEERMAASSKFNRVKADIAALEKNALRDDRQVSADQKLVNQLAAEATAQKKSLNKAVDWKDTVCNAVEFPRRLRWPLHIGDKGFLGDLVIWDIGDDGFSCLYDAFEITSEGHNAEGIVDLNGNHHEVALLVQGVESRSLKAGGNINLDRTFVIVRKKMTGDQVMYVLRPSPLPDDTLWKVISADVTEEELNAGSGK
jgi:hypothetical protein